MVRAATLERGARLNPDLVRWSVDPALLREATHSRRGEVRRAAAENPNTPRSALGGLAKDRDRLIREAVASNTACPNRVLEVLSRDPVPYVRQMVAQNPRVPRSILKGLKKDHDAAVCADAWISLSYGYG